MMLRNLLIFSFLLSVFVVNGQSFIPKIYDTIQRDQEFILTGFADAGGTSINNELMDYFIYGGEIPLEVRQSNFENQTIINRFGFEQESNFEYRNYNVNLFKNRNWGIVVKAGQYQNFAGNYSQDLFGLAFIGNESYLGEKASLSPTTIGGLNAHKLSFGLIDRKTKSSVSFNLYGIKNYLNGYIRNGGLLQDSSGSNIEFTLDGSFESVIQKGYYNGVGFGFDVDYNLPVTFNDREVFFNFKLNNLGVGIITSDVVRYQMDTIINYSGFEVSDFMNNEVSLSGGNSFLDELGIRKDTISKVVFLPFNVQISKMVDELNTNVVQAFYGVRVNTQYGVIPMGFAGAHFRISNVFRAGLNVGYGGFSMWRFGAYVQTVWNQFNLGIGCENLYGAISKNGKGQAFSLRLNYRI